MNGPFRDDPTRVLPLSLDPQAADRDAALLRVVRAIVPAWSDVGEAAVHVVQGGITNLLFRLEAAGCEPVLVRIYGDNTEVVIDREAENRLFASLSAADFGPTYHGRFANGRVEGWLQGFRALEPPELGAPGLRRQIARHLRTFHGLVDVGERSALWQTLGSWMETARSVRFDGADGVRWAALRLDYYASVLSGLRSVEGVLVRANGTRSGWLEGFRSVMAHNDLLAGNVLMNADRTQVHFVDYEYGAPAPAAFDVANHFCEYAGFDSDFEQGFPSRAVRDDFIAAYLDQPVDSPQVAGFSRAVEFYVLPDHLWWGSWAVVQARYSPIDFDYLEYARLRLAGLDLHLGELGFTLP